MKSKSITFLILFVALSTASKTYDIQPRIIEGEDAKEGDVPYIALIKVFNPHLNESIPVCAGAILSELNIITSAVCASICNVTNYCQVFVVRIVLDDGGYEVKINKTLWHQSYVSYYMTRWPQYGINRVIDIGMLHTEKIIMSPTAQALTLSGHEITEDFDVEVAGWGSNSDRQALQFAKIKVRRCFDRETSLARYGCLLEDDPAIACVSDMGAVMIHAGTNKLAGIDSHFTYWACNISNPRFTRTYKYCSWILANMMHEEEPPNGAIETFACNNIFIIIAVALIEIIILSIE